MSKYFSIIISLAISLCAFSHCSVASSDFTAVSPSNSTANDIEMYLDDVRFANVLIQAGIKWQDIESNVLNVAFQPSIGTFDAAMDNFDQIFVILATNSGGTTEFVSFDRYLHKASLQHMTINQYWEGVLPMNINTVSGAGMLIGYEKVKKLARKRYGPSSEAATVIIYKNLQSHKLVYDYRMTKELGNMQSCAEYLYIQGKATASIDDNAKCKFSLPPQGTSPTESKLRFNLQ